tara:strand:- start:4555 stop:4785 length:231 start_codon:yes stop_codon:yes gene_type:complete
MHGSTAKYFFHGLAFRLYNEKSHEPLLIPLGHKALEARPLPRKQKNKRLGSFAVGLGIFIKSCLNSGTPERKINLN